jgi:putative oxygen-independent coproporphyrinogen III oxidase
MPGLPPEGVIAPPDGQLGDRSLSRLGAQSLSAYVHIPFCASRCGYCDFNTYTADELEPGANRADYAGTVIREIEFARGVLGENTSPLHSVFFGGGTPTLLPSSDLARILHALRDTFALAPGAEITTEANPDSVDKSSLAALRDAGFTRISFGWQATAPHVLAVLERTHNVDKALSAVRAAQEVGFEHVSVDLIYGTPGETDDNFRDALSAAIDSGVDHVSAYALIVEDGTRLGAAVKRGTVPQPSDDVAADRYLIADEMLSAAGLDWYEVSNWARPGGECRHNLAYWRNADWWGFGPGAHSHIGGTRWWNVRHPSAYATRIDAGESPAQAREELTDADQELERVLLGIRLKEGLAGIPEDLSAPLIDEGLLEHHNHRLVLTQHGRLLADLVVRRLT